MPAVLVVDDSPVDRRLVQSILQKNTDLVVSVAAGGREALQQMHSNPADLVITDLQMPDMNGLDLLNAMRLEFPQTPVVLITAHGSEELAVQALHEGAASYVPKPQLASRLLPTVAQVFEMTQMDQSYDRFARCMDWAEFQMSLENDFELVDRCVDLIQSMVLSTQDCAPADYLRLATGLHAALQEAVLRGNMEFTAEQARAFELETPDAIAVFEQRRSNEPYCQRLVRFRARLSRSSSHFVIGYEGPCFEFEVPSADDERAALAGGAGRGLLLLATYMDSVTADPKQREITIIKSATEPTN